MWQGNVEKMHNKLGAPVSYTLPIGDDRVDINPLIGKFIRIEHSGTINCINCGAKTKKSYSQGYCYPCMKKLAACDMCIVKPETCHFDQGTCREPDWAETHCMRPHYAYLSNSSGVKVGITRETQIPTRWIDQGAIQALAIARAQTRFQVGLLEVAIKQHLNDKTDWRKMLRNQVESIDLTKIRDDIFVKCQADFDGLNKRFGQGAIELLPAEKQVEIAFPVDVYPEKVKSFNLDKNPIAEGMLQGIKGQYLIMDTGVINIRKYTGYDLKLSAE